MDGFIGRHLSRYLIGAGASVAGIGPESSSAGTEPIVSIWSKDQISEAVLSALLERTGMPDTIFHLAGGASVGASLSDPYTDYQRTVASTAIVLEWIRTRAPSVRLIQISSAAVYGSGHSGPISEDNNLNPYSPYGTHKLVAEMLCRSYAVNFGLDVVIVRPFSIFGEGLRKQLLWDFCWKLRTKPQALSLDGTGNELRDWMHVSDLVRALAELIEFPSGTVINAGTGTGIPVSAVVRMLLEAWGMPDLPVHFSGKGRPGDPKSLVADVTRLRAFGMAASSDLAQRIRDYVRWFEMQ